MYKEITFRTDDFVTGASAKLEDGELLLTASWDDASGELNITAYRKGVLVPEDYLRQHYASEYEEIRNLILDELNIRDIYPEVKE